MKRDAVLDVLNMMYDESVDAEYASPNFVADFANNRDVKLDSEEVVMISNYYGEANCPTGRSSELDYIEPNQNGGAR